MNSHEIIAERLRFNRAKLFRGVTWMTSIVVEYWLEDTKRILDDTECTPEPKLRGTISLLRDEAYR